ncbi:MAG: hypothetical protein LC798_12100 [Chloroflexi bacterium]|nr:hypothetical protein [Chloroflexota bacterium]
MPESATDYMLVAGDALRDAAQRFTAAGDHERARHTLRLAEQVAAEDPELHDRVWRALPGDDAAGVRPDPIARALSLPLPRVHCVLDALRRRDEARQTGGWWKRHGDLSPSTLASTSTR